MAANGEPDSGSTPDIAFSLNFPGDPVGGSGSDPADVSVGEPGIGDLAGEVSASAGAQDITAAEPVDHRSPATDSPDAGSSAEGVAHPTDFADRIAEGLVATAPAGWDRLYAEFAITVAEHHARAIVTAGDTETVVEIPDSVLATAREYRAEAVHPERGPWWRLLVHITADRVIELDYDYGDEPFPDDQLFGPAAYRADLAEYPRDRLPVWLAAYIGHGGRQTRSPRRAYTMARTDRTTGVWSELAENEFPPFPVMWARWAALAAAFTAAGSEWGPRMLPSLGWFESSRRSGTTLYALPGDRAVLSGGVWADPRLAAVYNESAAMPGLYRGAPAWVADPVLNPRAASGLLSFCYWWEGGRWYRGESPPARDCASALPGIWTADTVVDIATRVAGPRDGTETGIRAFVEAAEAGEVTEDTVRAAFGAGPDVGSALFQLHTGGLLTDIPGPLPEELALRRVRQYVTGRGLDTTGYPLDELLADRLDCGWMVYVPVPDGELAIGRAIFYIADDGVLEPSSSSVPPARFVAEFSKRYEQRNLRV